MDFLNFSPKLRLLIVLEYPLEAVALRAREGSSDRRHLVAGYVNFSPK